MAEGIKTIETRSWEPPKALIGLRIAIHAAKKKMGMGTPPSLVSEMLKATGGRCPLGAVVATATLSDYIRVEREYMDGWVEGFNSNDKLIRVGRDFYGDFETGRWLWFLEDIQKLDPPVPEKGHQGFWTWEPEETIE